MNTLSVTMTACPHGRGLSGPASAEPPRAPATSARARRVAVALGAVVFMSAVDLAATLHFMTTVGMYEANPLMVLLARSTGSPLAIALYKVVTVWGCVALLYALRHRWQAEAAAWISAAILAWLLIAWTGYATAVADLDPAAMAAVAGTDATWVVLDGQ